MTDMPFWPYGALLLAAASFPFWAWFLWVTIGIGFVIIKQKWKKHD